MIILHVLYYLLFKKNTYYNIYINKYLLALIRKIHSSRTKYSIINNLIGTFTYYRHLLYKNLPKHFIRTYSSRVFIMNL